MKKSWLNALENVSLVGLGAGSVASVLLNQLLYTTTPLSVLMVLGILNRRQLAQTSRQREDALAESEQFLALKLERMHQQLETLPPPEAFNRLSRSLNHRNHEVSERLHREISSLKQSLHQRVASIEQQSVSAIEPELRQLSDRCNAITEKVSQLSTEVSGLSVQVQTEGTRKSIEELRQDVASLRTTLDSFSYQTRPALVILQEHISRLDRQFSKLPPPVDLGSLKQEVAELIKIVADLVPRRDWSSLADEMKQLHDQQETLKQSIVAIETAALNFKRTFNALPQAAQETFAVEQSDSPQISELSRPMPLMTRLTAPSVYPELQELAANYLINLRSQLSTIQTVTTDLVQQQKQLREQLNQLPPTLDVVALQQQLSELAQRVPVSETALESFKSRIQAVMQQELNSINQQLQVISSTPHSELVFDAAETSESCGSRTLLETALASTQTRLILIWPWSEFCELDEALYHQFETFLSQGRRLEIGWCYLADRQEERWLNKIQRGWITDLTERSDLQDTLHKLLQLKRMYADRFQFKILGSSENFLVSDQSFAVLGLANGLQTTEAPELQIKLKTSEASVIQRLIDRFDNPELAETDVIAYWNRAVTRHDLGDKSGAIADYSHILQLSPEDAITYNYRGLAHYEAGDFEAAIVDFSHSIQHNPEQASAYSNRGFIYTEQGQLQKAINDYTTAIQTCPELPIPYFYRGLTQQKREHYRAAVSDYSEAIRLAPNVPAAYYYRALAWQKLEQIESAIADYELAAQFFWMRGSKTNAKKALQMLSELQHRQATADANSCEVYSA